MSHVSFLEEEMLEHNKRLSSCYPLCVQPWRENCHIPVYGRCAYWISQKGVMLILYWNRFSAGIFHFLQYGPACSHKIQNVPHCHSVLYVATLAVDKAEQQGVFEEFSIDTHRHSHLAVVHSTSSSAVLTSLEFPNKHAKHDQLFLPSYLVGLNSSSYRCNLCP